MVRTETLCINMELGIRAYVNKINGIDDYLSNLNNPFTKLSIEQLVAFIESRDDPKTVEKIMRLITPAQRSQLQALESQVEEEVIEEALTEVFNDAAEVEPEEDIEVSNISDEDDISSESLFESDDEEYEDLFDESVDVNSESDKSIESDEDDWEDEPEEQDNVNTLSASEEDIWGDEPEDDWSEEDVTDTSEAGIASALAALYDEDDADEDGEDEVQVESHPSQLQVAPVSFSNEAFEGEAFEDEADSDDEPISGTLLPSVMDKLRALEVDDEELFSKSEESEDTEFDDESDSDEFVEFDSEDLEDELDEADIVTEEPSDEADEEDDALAELLAPRQVSPPPENSSIFSHTAMTRAIKQVEASARETSVEPIAQPPAKQERGIVGNTDTPAKMKSSSSGISAKTSGNNMRIRRNTVVQEPSLDDSSVSNSICGEKFDPSWSILQYLSANKDNKEARHIDIVSRYFPISLIKRGEDAGQFIISKGYLRK